MNRLKLTAIRDVNWRNISIALTDPEFGKQKAQSGENACFRQLCESPATRVLPGCPVPERTVLAP